LVAVDDVQWLDSPSREVLTFAAPGSSRDRSASCCPSAPVGCRHSSAPLDQRGANASTWGR
jgi:hypothetical protein